MEIISVMVITVPLTFSEQTLYCVCAFVCVIESKSNLTFNHYTLKNPEKTHFFCSKMNFQRVKVLNNKPQRITGFVLTFQPASYFVHRISWRTEIVLLSLDKSEKKKMEVGVMKWESLCNSEVSVRGSRLCQNTSALREENRKVTLLWQRTMDISSVLQLFTGSWKNISVILEGYIRL